MSQLTYLQIANELKKKIQAGDLKPGEKVPSTRQIMRRFGVAMATASKVLAALQQEGLVRSVRGAGSVVTQTQAPAKSPSESPADEPAAKPKRAEQLSKEQVEQAAISIADKEGLSAVSIRRIATDLGVSPMALYRHIPNKEELLLQMSEAIMSREPLPEASTRSWRAQLEAVARLQWKVYKAHPWLAQVFSLSFTRPQPAPNAMDHTERILRAIEGLPLTPTERLHVAVTLFGYVQGTAHKLVSELEAQNDTGITSEEWMEASSATFASVVASERFRAMSALVANPELDLNLDSLFDFGLRRLLDGFSVFFGAK